MASDIDLDLLRLALVPGLTPHAARAALEAHGTPSAVLRACRGGARVPGAGPVLSARLADPPGTSQARAELRRARRLGIRILGRDDPEYPPRLSEIPDAPLALWVRGVAAADDDAVAVVGARRASVYGRAQAERFGRSLGRAGVTVVSGLARGVDAAAHQGALAGGGRTVAVLGSGQDRLYPPEHRSLAREIVRTGAVLSEFPLGTRPRPWHFPLRNRVIAGLSRGVLVVEGGVRSGSLITAGLAGEYGRQVFAVPGRLDTELARGPNRLIRDGAVLVEGPGQVLEDLGYRSLFEGLAEEARPRPEDPLQRRLLDLLDTVEPSGVDELLRRAGSPAPAVLSALLALELGGHVRALPGRRYVAGLREPPG